MPYHDQYEFTKNEWLLNLESLRKFEETTHTQKYARKRIGIENALKTHWRGSEKEKKFCFPQVISVSYAIQEKFNT